MKCDICRKKSAVIFVQQVSRDGSIELHLCEECARERGFTTGENRMDISLGGIFSGILEKQPEKGPGIVSCSVCGLTVTEIKKTGRAGCSECYRTFNAEIISFLRKEGLELSYSGQFPRTHDGISPTKVHPDNLKEELKKAIEREDYELAAYYRDRIRALGEES